VASRHASCLRWPFCGPPARCHVASRSHKQLPQAAPTSPARPVDNPVAPVPPA
jgi:hypothetical protein